MPPRTDGFSRADDNSRSAALLRAFRILCASGLSRAANGVQHGNQLVSRKGLAQASRKAAVREIPGFQLPACRNRHHGKRGIHAAHRRKDAETVGRRHLYIGQHHVEAAVRDQFRGIFGVLTALGSDTRLTAHRGGHFELQRIVVDQQRLHAATHRRHARFRRPQFAALSARNGSHRDRNDEFAPFAQTAFERYGPLQQFHEPIDDRQPQSESIDALRRAQTHEFLKNPLLLFASDAASRIADREDEPALHHIDTDRHRAFVSKFQRVGDQVVGDLPDTERIARHLAPGRRFDVERQPDALRPGLRRKSGADRFEQLRRAERDLIDVHLVDIEAVEVQQAVHQRQQMFRRLLHVMQVQLLALVAGQARKQVDIAHHRTQRRLDVVRDGQHQLLARRQQRFVVAVGPLQRPPVAVAAVDVAPQDADEQQHEHHGRDGDHAQRQRRTAADGLRLLEAVHQKSRILGFEIHDKAVYLRVHQLVAVPQAHPFVPRPVVDADAVAGHPVLQRPQHHRDRILHLRRRQRIHDHARSDGVRRPYDDAVPVRRAVRRTDQLADILVQQAGRGGRTDRPPQAHRPPLLVGQKTHDAVQTHRLQRILRSGQPPQRVDQAAHGAQFAFVAGLVGLVSGDHQLAVTLGLIKMVERLSRDAAFGMEQGIAAVGSRKTHHRPVDIAYRKDADRDQDRISRENLGFDEFRLFHAFKDKGCGATFGGNLRLHTPRSPDPSGQRYEKPANPESLSFPDRKSVPPRKQTGPYDVVRPGIFSDRGAD